MADNEAVNWSQPFLQASSGGNRRVLPESSPCSPDISCPLATYAIHSSVILSREAKDLLPQQWFRTSAIVL
jgi:hypothetical protein